MGLINEYISRINIVGGNNTSLLRDSRYIVPHPIYIYIWSKLTYEFVFI